MLNELNKASFGHQGGYGYHQGYAGYDNYGQDPDEFYDMEDVWSNDNKYYGQQRYKVNILLHSGENVHNLSKNHIFKISVFTKFTFSKISFLTKFTFLKSHKVIG